MTSSAPKTKPRAQAKQRNASKEKKQWILVTVLLVGLCVVLFRSSEDEAESSVSASNPPPAKTTRDVSVSLVSAGEASSPSAAVPPRPQSFLCEVELPRIALDRLVESDPFVRPTPPPPAPVDPPDPPESPAEAPPAEASVEKTEPPQVRAVYGGSGRRSALVGEAIVQPGQALPDGSRVLDVTADGVKLGR